MLGEPDGDNEGCSVMGAFEGRFDGALVGCRLGDFVGSSVVDSGAAVGLGVKRGMLVPSLDTGEGVNVVIVLSHSACKATSWLVVTSQPRSWTYP